MKNYIIILFQLLIFINSYSYINIYPLTFDKRIDGLGEIEEYVLNNITNEPKKYRINIEKVENNDMSDWIEIYPRSLVLSPGEEGKIKVYINSSDTAEKKEYSSILNIEEMPVPSLKKNKDQLEVYTNLKMKIYGYVGELAPKIEVKGITATLEGNLKLMGIIENKTERRIDIEILLGNNKTKYLVAEKRLRKDEIVDISTLSLLWNIEEVKNIQDKLKEIYIVEKGTENVLEVIHI